MTDYMATDLEMKKQPEAFDYISKASAGNPLVFGAMWSFWNFAHAWDDLIDGSDWKQERKEQAWKALHDFTTSLMVNPFVRDNSTSIHGMMVSAITRAIDGDTKFKDSPLGPAVRCGDIDVLLHLVYLYRGYEGLREYSAMREYDEGKD